VAWSDCLTGREAGAVRSDRSLPRAGTHKSPSLVWSRANRTYRGHPEIDAKTHLRHQRAIFAVMHSGALGQRCGNVRAKPEEGCPYEAARVHHAARRHRPPFFGRAGSAVAVGASAVRFAGSAAYRKPRKTTSSRSIASRIASACWLFSAMTCGALSADKSIKRLPAVARVSPRRKLVSGRSEKGC
jgi:hypothetical protein